MNIAFYLILLGLFFFIMLIFTWIIFGKLIMLQIKRWFLAGKGYVEVEHISATKVRNYFIMKPKNNKFDINDGFYHFIPECITRKGDIIKKYDKDFLKKETVEFDDLEFEGMTEDQKKAYKTKVLAEFNEMKKIIKVISDIRYDPELLNRKMGMPVITYYADNPDPMNFKERDKAYGSGVIKDMYLRLLLTQRYKDFKMFVVIGVVCLGIIAIANVGFYYNSQALIKNNQQCLTMLNNTRTQCDLWINNSLNAIAQRTTPTEVLIK